MALLSFQKFAAKIGNAFNAREAVAAPISSQNVLADAQLVSRYAQTVGTSNSTARSDQSVSAAHAALDEFLRATPDKLQDLRKLFSEISRSPSPMARQQILIDIRAQMGALKEQLGTFELRPAWQLASALEGLFEQLADQPSELTPSTLRTAAGALVFLDSLCVAGLRPDLAHNPTTRFLAVDDDPVSSKAVSMALKKSFAPPDIAEDGAAALKLAAEQAYEIVFLDVEMPGMDGYEVCMKIHELAANRNTPVVFVTSHSDFDSRAKSTSSGGKDLVAKPFLTFEITVKALTLVLRSRLEQNKTRGAPVAVSSAAVAA